MNYINKKVTEIYNAKDISKIKKILCEMYTEIQMDSFVRQEFENEISKNGEILSMKIQKIVDKIFNNKNKEQTCKLSIGENVTIIPNILKSYK